MRFPEKIEVYPYFGNIIQDFLIFEKYIVK